MEMNKNPERYAFFDVDDTLIKVKSVFSFQEYWYDKLKAFSAQAAFEEEMSRLKKANAPWEILNTRYYAHFEGRRVDQLHEIAELWFAELEEANPDLYHTAIVERLQQHQSDGVTPVFVSGSFPAVLKPCAKRLGVEHILATRMEAVDGIYTGKILPPQTIGEGKATAVRAFLEERDALAEDCFAYGDDISDAPMLAAVGHPFAVSGGRGLADFARGKGWPVLEPYLLQQEAA